MNPALTEETLEEGRVALYRLERQLKEHHTRVDATSDNRDNRSESSSQRHSVSSDRRLLDQLPRTTRLNQRLESLGLTVEVRQTATPFLHSNSLMSGIGRSRSSGWWRVCSKLLHIDETKEPTRYGVTTPIASPTRTWERGIMNYKCPPPFSDYMLI